jgi:O-antigen/teichoic acid export membrane protein
LLTISTKIIETIIGLASFVIMARLLDPKDYGLFSIIMATYALISGFQDVGLMPAYIKSKVASNKLKNSFFTINIYLGIISVVFLVVASPILSKVYMDSSLISLTIVFSISVFLLSVSRQGVAELTREKKFKTLMRASLIASMFSTPIAFYAAYNNYGVWALNIRALSYALIYASMVLSSTGLRYNIVSYGEIKLFRKELKYSFEIMIGRVLNGILNSIDKFILGRIIGIDSLGQYRKSQELSRMTDTQVRMPLGEVVYSYLERSTAQNKKVLYNKYSIVMVLIALMVNGGLYIAGETLFPLVLGEKWSEAGTYVRYFSIFSTGIIAKGIYTTISMTENKMKRQNNFTAISIFMLIINLIIFRYFHLSLLWFVILFSLSTLIFWMALLSYELHNHNRSSAFVGYVTLAVLVLIMLDYIKFILFSDLLFSLIFTIAIYEAIILTLMIIFLRKFIIKWRIFGRTK